MLFIIVMDTLNLLISRAAEAGLLHPLSSRSNLHRLSLYADDVVLFLRPTHAEIELILKILQLFGEASGLKTNIQKSSVLPIHCAPELIESIQNQLPCKVDGFPFKYLGLPLSLKKLSKAQLQFLVVKVADLFPGWTG